MILKGKTALITGGTKGIGHAIALAFNQAGANVIVCARNKPAELDSAIQFISVDFSDRHSTETFLNNPVLKNIDILVNNAGINRINSFQDIIENDFDEIMNVNLKVPFLITKKVVACMKERKYGRIINIASIFGHITKEFRGSYSTSKFGLIGMTKAIAVEYASLNILCNAISPGFINTELTQSVLSADQIKELTALVPMKRLGTPEEIAKTALFLASSDNTFITGQNIIADGGFTSV